MKNYIRLLVLLFLPAILVAQRSYRSYDTQRYYRDYVLADADRDNSEDMSSPTLLDIEDQIAEIIDDIDLEPMRIGVVFHMLYTDDQKLAQDKVAEQLVQLNRDFNSLVIPEEHPNDPTSIYAKRAFNPNITFTLHEAVDIPDGMAEVTSHTTEEWDDYDDMKYDATGGSAAILPSEVINIWVVDLPDSMNSYSTSPIQDSEVSGIVIDHGYFGTPDTEEDSYAEGRTLTHLMGNYLGLSDLWSDYQRCIDDGVADTPLHNSMSTGCPGPGHVTTCYRDETVPAMTMNFMNNTDDRCQYMFTEGQVRRMRAMIAVTKPSLIR
jgi:hypothetical protein